MGDLRGLIRRVSCSQTSGTPHSNSTGNGSDESDQHNPALALDLTLDRFGELLSRCRATEVRSQAIAAFQNGLEGGENSLGSVSFVDVVQHHDRGQNHRGGIGDPFSFDVRCAAVHRLEERMGVAEIGAGDDTETSDQPAARSDTISP